jgi:glycosyltransferase involved in cell wall biosynthesis
MSAIDITSLPAAQAPPGPEELPDAQMRAPVSVITCAFSDARWQSLREAVASALAQEPSPLEVIVVIDHNDALFAKARRELHGARVVANADRPGLSGARNTGVRRARGTIVAFIDDDASAHAGWLSSLADAFSNAAVIGVGGVAQPRWETREPRWLPSEFRWVVGCSYRGLPEQRQPIRNPIGANMAFRRDAVERAGGFADGIGRVGSLPLGCEETELAIRASAVTKGMIVQLPACVVDHRVSAERARLRYFCRRCYAEGLSKALVTQSVGSDRALASERGYVLRTLPHGVARSLGEFLRGDPYGMIRAGVIIGGLATTAAGYLRGRLVR